MTNDMTGIKRVWATLDPFFESGPVLGRKVANVRFLDALLNRDSFDEYHFFLNDRGISDALRKHLEHTRPRLVASGRIRLRDRRELPSALADTHYHCFHQSDCILWQPHLIRLRNQVARDIFPVTGTIHSLSYADFGEAFLRHLQPGTTGRDAIVCTSSAGRTAVENFFLYLRENHGLSRKRFPAPELALIPLGVDASAMTPPRTRQGDMVRLLVFGRISHYSKMDLLPLLRALHRAGAEGIDLSGVELVLAGWVDDNDDFTPALLDLATNIGLRLRLERRPDEQRKAELFREADIFVSIADNPQETFGITLLEAGAFGLPVVASDYDGYRDIVVHGETGLLVPTLGPARTDDLDPLAPLLFDNQYHLLLAQRTAVDVPGLASALIRLIRFPELRQAMGMAGRKRVEAHFSWDSVVEQHEILWDRLREIPVDREALRNAAQPQQIPYGRVFGHYASHQLGPDIVLTTGRTGHAFYRGRDFPLLYSGLVNFIDPEAARKLAFLARKPVRCEELVRKLREIFPNIAAQQAENHILWAVKHDILEVVAPEENTGF
ncbi:glycosyltransferase family 4 protein [Pseudodesulfovibrio tunisiensis]|uniref:glycosyltransferase family 4 protein n=1 Tax=Pseudodesulfovibrio tunisiensis TaxID=463192 RepID=UPI00311F4384